MVSWANVRGDTAVGLALPEDRLMAEGGGVVVATDVFMCCVRGRADDEDREGETDKAREVESIFGVATVESDMVDMLENGNDRPAAKSEVVCRTRSS